jgi:hypothetical protein
LREVFFCQNLTSIWLTLKAVYNLFQNQKSTTCWIMLAEKKKSLEKVKFFWVGSTSRQNLTLNCWVYYQTHNNYYVEKSFSYHIILFEWNNKMRIKNTMNYDQNDCPTVFFHNLTFFWHTKNKVGDVIGCIFEVECTVGGFFILKQIICFMCIMIMLDNAIGIEIALWIAFRVAFLPGQARHLTWITLYATFGNVLWIQIWIFWIIWTNHRH